MTVSVRNLPLNAIRVFSTVYQTGGVRAAAREMRISHSSVSRHLRACEDALGVALIERQRGVLKFTEAGELLGRKSVECLSQLANLSDGIGLAGDEGEVLVAAPLLFAQRWLLPKIAALQKELHGTYLRIIPDSPPIQTSLYDIRIGFGRSKDEEGSVPFLDDFIVPVASPNYIDRLNSVSPLKNANLLHSNDPDASWERWQKTFGESWLDVSAGALYANLELAMEAAAIDLGVALVRRRLAEPELRVGRLISLGAAFEFELKGAYWIGHGQQDPPSQRAKQAYRWITEEAERAAQRTHSVLRPLPKIRMRRFGTDD